MGALIPQRNPGAPHPQTDGEQKAESRPPVHVQDLSVDLIDPNPHQPRVHFDHGELEELVGSIKEHGVIQPLLVTATPTGRYELIAGERRLRASQIAGFERVPAIVRTATEQQKMELALIENVQRSDLNPIEEARAYLCLQDEFGMTQDEVGRRAGKSRPQVANTIRLLQLPEVIQHALVEKRISASNARTLLSLPTEEERLSMFKAMLEGNFTVRQTEARVPHARRSPGQSDPNLLALEERMREALGLKVRIKRDARGEGDVMIGFLNEEDLKKIIDKLFPQ